MINNQPSQNDQFNPWLAVDETNGNLIIIYYDTVNDTGRHKTDVWMQTSTDDGATWSAAQKVTTAQTDETVTGADLNQYGDYNALSGYGGKFFPCWTDRRSGRLEEVWTSPIKIT
jgi:Neuraminidase (sialidase)